MGGEGVAVGVEEGEAHGSHDTKKVLDADHSYGDEGLGGDILHTSIHVYMSIFTLPRKGGILCPNCTCMVVSWACLYYSHYICYAPDIATFENKIDYETM